MAISSTTLTLSPQMNALAVMVQGQQEVFNEMQKTKEVFAEYVKESQETIASQAEENQKLKMELASLKQMHEREMSALGPQYVEIICYARVGSFTCCLSFESFQAHIQADWKPHQNKMSYRAFLEFFLEQIRKSTGPEAQAANDTLIEWFPLACSNLKTYEENRKRGIHR